MIAALQDTVSHYPIRRFQGAGLAALRSRARFNTHSPLWAAYCKSPYRERSGSGILLLLMLSLPERSRYSAKDFTTVIASTKVACP